MVNIPKAQLSPRELARIRADITKYTMPDICIIIKPGLPVDDGMGGTQPGPDVEIVSPCSQKAGGKGDETLYEGIQEGRLPWPVKLPYGTPVDRSCRIEVRGGAAGALTFTADPTTNRLNLSQAEIELYFGAGADASMAFAVGQRVNVLALSGQLPAPLKELMMYYVVVLGPYWLQVSEERAGAVLEITEAGAGPYLVTPCRRLEVLSVGDGDTLGTYTKVSAAQRS